MVTSTFHNDVVDSLNLRVFSQNDCIISLFDVEIQHGIRVLRAEV